MARTLKPCERCRERPKIAGRGQRFCAECKVSAPACDCGGLKDKYVLRTHPTGATYRMWYCRPCDAAKTMARYYADPDAYNIRRKAAMYGITVEEYAEHVASGVCDICSKEPTGKRHESVLHIDHDHSTGRVRGALCGNCNKALGLVSDNVEVLERMIDYLRRSNDPSSGD